MDAPDSRRAGFAVPVGVDAVQQLGRVTSELGAASDMAGIVDAAVTHIATAIQAATATLLIVDGENLVMVGGHGLRPGTDATWGSISLTDDNPASEAARRGLPVLVPTAAEVEHRYPALSGWMPPGRSLMNLPLGAGVPPAGVIGLTFEDGWLPGPAELEFLTTFADACGQGIRRLQAAQRARAALGRLTFLSRASTELASSLDFDATLTRVADLVVPDLADWCVVNVGTELDAIAVSHVDPARVAAVWELERDYPPLQTSPIGRANVIRTGVSELLAVVPDERLVRGARGAEHLRLLRLLGIASRMVVPLTTRGRTLGAITLVRGPTSSRYDGDDLAAAEDLAQRAAVSLDNARLHSQAQGIALTLQRAVLPESLDGLAGWEIATHYEPAGPGDVGGDFYDAVLLDDGGLALFVGDVMGRGVQAAAAMAQTRAAIRAYLCVDAEPGVLATKLDAMQHRFGGAQLVTLLYARIDGAGERLDLISAGHLPPLLVGSDGTTRWPELQVRPPLGVASTERVSGTASLRPGDTLLLFTDGLVERRDEDIDVGLQRLAAGAGTLASGALTDRLAMLVDGIERERGSDDVTALAVRRWL